MAVMMLHDIDHVTKPSGYILGINPCAAEKPSSNLVFPVRNDQSLKNTLSYNLPGLIAFKSLDALFSKTQNMYQ